MKKKILASLVATMAVGATCAFAANPFVDVPTDSWAYKSVVELADAGVIQGVDGSYFQGERNITRYEAAEMVAKAMAHMDKANLEQRATINKLANEYADELNSLGVRVSNLEQKVGNVKMTGDFRIRYINQQDAFKGDDGKVKDDQFTYRARIRANAYVNDSTAAQVGFSTDNRSFDDSVAGPYQQNESRGTFNDDAWVQHYFGKNFNVKVGRWDAYILGNNFGYNFGNTFDGIQGQYKTGNFALTAGYGKFKDASGNNYTYTDNSSSTQVNKYVLAHDLNNMTTGYGEIEGFFKNGAIGVYYNSFAGRSATGTGTIYGEGVTVSPVIANGVTTTTYTTTLSPKDLWGVYGKINFGQDWHFNAEYQKVKLEDSAVVTVDDPAIWTAQLQYGQASFAKKGSWDAWLEYVNADANALYGLSWSWRNNNLLDNVKSWAVGVDYTWAKNAQFQIKQTFSSSVKDDKWGVDPNEETRAQFVFVF